MFTGIIEEIGEVAVIERHGATARITVHSRQLAPHLKTGDSIAVSGVCLTAIDPHSDRFSADLAAETVVRTSLSGLQPGSKVNLELPTRAGAPLGGHVVQGHVDGTGRLLSLEAAGDVKADCDWVLRVQVPAELLRYVVHKGSITIEGISLTVAALNADEVQVAIIPHTYRATNLHALAVDSRVNIEVDVLAKYAERMAQLKPEASALTIADLMAKGF